MINVRDGKYGRLQYLYGVQITKLNGRAVILTVINHVAWEHD